MSITEIVDNHMPSITEWMEKIAYKNLEAFRSEDNNKRDRLEILFKTIGLAYDRPVKMRARDITDETPLFLETLRDKGDEKCALRLVPIKTGLPKLRVRGKTLRENLQWFFAQDINPDDYKVEIIPHNDDTTFSAIFLVSDTGVWGEIIPGPHWQLTQGIYEKATPIFFSFDFHQWQFSRRETETQEIMRAALAAIKVSDKKHQNQLAHELNAEFTKENYLKGYFEFVVWPPDNSIAYIDYNRVLYQMLKNIRPPELISTARAGVCASPGQATGAVRIINDPQHDTFAPGDILVCDMTMADYLPLMKKAAAIITEQGGLLTHAAIVSRELGKPCLVGVKNARARFPNGQIVSVDAQAGIIKIAS